MVFARMTAPEIGAVARDTLVVVPVGSTEQHGLHLPVDTDTRLVTAVAEGMERRCNILLAPTLWLGHSPHHLSFGGTLSANHNTMAAVLCQVAESFAAMGFARLLFLNGHGGNGLPLAMALQTLKTQHPGLWCAACNYWQLAAKDIARLRKSPPGGMGHACELETSLYLYLAPEEVRTDKIADAGALADSPCFQSEMFLAAPVAAVQNFAEFTKTGVFGKPSLASAAQGEVFFEAIVDALAELVSQISIDKKP